MNRTSRNKGFVLMAVLVVILLASMVAVSLMFRLRAEELASAAGTDADQGLAAAMSGVYAAMEVAAATTVGSLDWHNSPERFQQRLVRDDGDEKWYFTVYSAGATDTTGDTGSLLRHGLTDDASQINVNATHQPILEKLPRITPVLAQSLRDYCDADFVTRPQGAEEDYYRSLTFSYPVRNGPLASLDQILQVRGFTPAILFGEDANENYRLDPNEDDSDEQFPPDDGDGNLNRGLAQYLTVWSYDPNVEDSGAPRREINSPEETFFDVPLPGPVVEYILALRRNKIWIEHPVNLLAAKTKIKNLAGAEVELESGLEAKDLPLVLDAFTSTNASRFPGLVNVNTASAVVLQTIPGIDLTLAETIVAARAHLAPEKRRSIAWLFQEGIVDADLFKQLAPLLTARSFQFHFRVVGYSLPNGRYRIMEAVIDLGLGRPSITYLREVTRAGLPFPLLTESFPGHG